MLGERFLTTAAAPVPAGNPAASAPFASLLSPTALFAPAAHPADEQEDLLPLPVCEGGGGVGRPRTAAGPLRTTATFSNSSSLTNSQVCPPAPPPAVEMATR